MSDNVGMMVKILAILEKQMDYDKPDPSEYSAESLGISEPRRDRIFEMLARLGYIVEDGGTRITFRGLETLERVQDETKRMQRLEDEKEESEKNVKRLEALDYCILIFCGFSIGLAISMLI